MPNWEVYDINQVKVGDMTQDEVDTKLFDSSSLDGLRYFFYDTNIYTGLADIEGSGSVRIVKVVEDAPEV